MKLIVCEHCEKVFWNGKWESVNDVLSKILETKERLHAKKIEVQFTTCRKCK